MSWSWWKSCGSLLTVILVRKILVYRQNTQKMSSLPGLRCLLSPFSALGASLPTCFLNPGLNWTWLWRHEVYSKHETDTISVIPLLVGAPLLITRSLHVARQVMSAKNRFVTPEQTIMVASEFGRNLFTENGAEWIRHRRIMNPAFSPEIYARVWDETVGSYQQMLTVEKWTEGDVHVPVVKDLTMTLGLCIISRCGFGYPIAWKSRTTVQNSSDRTNMEFAETLRIVSGTIIQRLVIPRWMYHLPIASLRKIQTACRSLDEFMRTLIETRREELAANHDHETQDNQRKDVFRLMIRANEAEGEEGELCLSSDELIGNTFLLLFAGHETTSRALDTTIGFLALYEELQDEVYQEICGVMSPDRKLRFEDYSRLKKLQSCFLEAARLFSPGTTIVREATETIALETDEGDGRQLVVVEPGTFVTVDLIGIHHNPKYFPEPEEFRPSRWYDTSENDMNMFSLGPRTCIGRKFALTESMAFLSHLLRDWKLEAIFQPEETRAQWRKRVMTGVPGPGLNFGIGNVPVRFTRR